MLEFTQLLAAVRKSERTDQYLILSALYALKASHEPVTANAIRKTIAHHAKDGVPSNVPARLRAYTGLVDPASPGPPITWRLTPKGLEKLRTLSGLELRVENAAGEFASDVGIVCALEQPELDAVIRAMGGAGAWRDVGSKHLSHLYRETSLQLPNGTRLKVVATTATSMGLTAAAIATSHLIYQFRPRLVIMPGIAAGTKDGGKQFGDVLVADPSVDYNSGKVVDRDGISDFQPDPYPIGLNPRLRSLLQKYRGNHPTFEAIRKRWNEQLPNSGNRLHLGPLGAADQVIDNSALIEEIRNHWRKLIGVEMETYGVYRACIEAPDPKPRYVSFKAVCDFAASKTDSWQSYAAFMAAEFTVAFLKEDWPILWPTPT